MNHSHVQNAGIILSDKWKFRFVMMGYWGAQSAFSGFMGNYMLSAGMTATGIGTANAVNFLVAIIGQYVWGALSDKLRNNKLTFLSAFALTGILDILFYLSDSNIPWLCITYATIGFARAGLLSMLDTWVVKHFPNDQSAFSSIRYYGSFVYAAGSIFMGRIIDSIGYIMMPVMFVIYFLIALAASMGIHQHADNAPETEPESAEQKMRFIDSLAVFRVPGYPLLVLTMFLSGFSVMAMWRLMAVLFETVGGTKLHIGLYQAATGFLQAPLMILIAKYGKRASLQGRFAFAMTISIFEPFFFFIAKSPWVMLMGGLIDGISYSFMITSIRQLAPQMAPDGLQNSAMAFCDMAFFSISAMIASFIGGRIIDAYSGTTWALIATIVGILSAVTGIIFWRNFAKYEEMGKKNYFKA